MIVAEKSWDAKWLMQTWNNYLRPRYRKFLKKWNKETGGGSRTLECVPNYTNDGKVNSPWLLWAYYLGSKHEFLLANNTSGTVPGFV